MLSNDSTSLEVLDKGEHEMKDSKTLMVHTQREGDHGGAGNG